MKRYRHLKEEPFLSIIKEEWKKAKKIFQDLKNNLFGNGGTKILIIMVIVSVIKT